ncbi:peptide ABC transporter ATP-binding protein [Alsobacter metallidurans]|uniref:Peptide ABC transporter ATP-binding protein n=1 Tax=Alsobacter metallidurans TaxID=340221 RepID=A0A917MGB1_9HYPH|nr:oligopeptide/dipeptide ABC transporter ATP-binding protein [Alsobacter metallidurans]GGH09130.1 peptide ABC transporter ATP-binding protein [Alsobacter metallidurans]
MTPLLDVRGLTKHYAGPHGRVLHALEDVSFTVAAGEALGVVGESGCGKSTLGKSLLRLVEPTAGEVLFEGEDVLPLSRRAMAAKRRDMQMVFQDPFGSLNPRHSVGTIVGEPLAIHGMPGGKARVAELLDQVGLPADAAGRYPHEFSGGQRQRVAIARALALGPKLLVADEPVSALDVSIQSQIINLIGDLRRAYGLAMIFISHDLSVIRHVSDRIAVMYLGRIVEIGPAAQVFEAPAHPYTRALLSAVPRRPGAAQPRERIILHGDLPDPSSPPPGCAFHGRCPAAMPRCSVEPPELVSRHVAETGGTAIAACHLHEHADAPALEPA